MAFISLWVVLLLLLVAIFAPLVAPYPPDATDYGQQLAPIGTPGHLLGTDTLGRDILSRLVFGFRTAFLVAFVAEVISVAVALSVGVVAGYRGGRADGVLMAATDVMYAFPTYLFAVLLVTVFGRSFWSVMAAIAIAGWVTQARLVRAQVMTLKKRDFVEAAQGMGAKGPTIATRYILPNALGPLLVTTSFAVPAAITTEAGLSLLGLGIADMPSWGAMINEGVRFATSSPHMIISPAIAFAVTLLAFTWIGDGVRDAFDITSEARA
ncbi:binding-protein-dependent transport systems inner membrane component [Beutenbergia cavernae DSM 12333]|uniref:Binding-protein-dependent transport systems inner membrane component n=1 Tax=Beutenbergia cavernae (strain ATCC BAA-8 / DSM 12333 / CCUG 43141 / JCM 11478 / NBRC 16432 / NCIMB 13614 / HKI 0122) TaxID=471853 RepID=C5C1H5_BEUC1|nr:ABC transporter permease [Beutenbergia cavernae]ACQ81585.1 binding-protein-dependent transport systems inner membrane component [Beutenbergia cavernae DSM 12333]